VATVLKRRTASGSAWLAQVRIAPYKPTSKTFPTRQEAVQWADDLERELKAERRARRTRPTLTKLTVACLVRQYLDDPETAALRSYASLEPLCAWWVNHYGGQRVLDLGALTLREARDRLRGGRSAGTVNRYLSALRAAWNWGRSAELIPAKLTWPSRLFLTEPKGRTRFLNDDELGAVLKAAREHSASMYAAIAVSIACGVRQSELLRLTWADVDFERGRLRVLLSKNDEARAVYLPATAAAALRELKRAPVVGQRVFLLANGEPLKKSTLETRWSQVRANAGLRDFRWHDLRHSCASFLAQQGANLLEIGTVLGHKSASVTKRYSHLVEGAPVTGHAALDRKLRGDL
jgi:integrase